MCVLRVTMFFVYAFLEALGQYGQLEEEFLPVNQLFFLVSFLFFFSFFFSAPGCCGYVTRGAASPGTAAGRMSGRTGRSTCATS